jgi:hypothetical protein
MANKLLNRIADGRTDLVFDFLAAGNPATSVDSGGTPLIKWCAYYGDVSAMRFLLLNGESAPIAGRQSGPQWCSVSRALAPL